MTATRDSVCAVVVTFNTGPAVHRCLDTIKAQVAEIVVVDNGSDAGTQTALADAGVTVLRNEENIGIAAALNRGVRYAIEQGHGYVLTLDHDSEATDGMVEALLAVAAEMGRDHRIGVVGPDLVDRNTNRSLIRPRLFRPGSDVAEVDTVLTSGSLMPVGVFGEVGFFTEDLFLYYVDDDFCLRCKRKGLANYVCRRAALSHREGHKRIRRVLGRDVICDNYDWRARYYISRNSIYMLKHHRWNKRYCAAVIERLFRDAVKILLFDSGKARLLRYSARGIGDGLRGRYGKLAE